MTYHYVNTNSRITLDRIINYIIEDINEKYHDYLLGILCKLQEKKIVGYKVLNYHDGVKYYILSIDYISENDLVCSMIITENMIYSPKTTIQNYIDYVKSAYNIRIV